MCVCACVHACLSGCEVFSVFVCECVWAPPESVRENFRILGINGKMKATVLLDRISCDF